MGFLFNHSVKIKYKVIKQVAFKDFLFVLFDLGDKYMNNASNLLAFDKDGYLRWTAEPPPNGSYSDFQIDEDASEIEADQHAVMFYTIGMADGKIKASNMRK